MDNKPDCLISTILLLDKEQLGGGLFFFLLLHFYISILIYMLVLYPKEK